jgi:ketosteroid isomerase-like protein
MRIQGAFLFLAAAVLLLTDCAASSGAIADSDRTAIRTTVDNFSKAILAGDYATATSYWAEDGTALPPNAPVAHGRADIQKLFSSFGKTTAFTEDVVETDGRGDLAYTHFTYKVTFTPPGTTATITDKGKGLIVWKKQSDNSWLVTRGAWNSDIPLAK